MKDLEKDRLPFPHFSVAMLISGSVSQKTMTNQFLASWDGWHGFSIDIQNLLPQDPWDDCVSTHMNGVDFYGSHVAEINRMGCLLLFKKVIVQGTIGCTPNNVPIVFIVFSRDSWAL